jgi:hypothetical protein
MGLGGEWEAEEGEESGEEERGRSHRGSRLQMVFRQLRAGP